MSKLQHQSQVESSAKLGPSKTCNVAVWSTKLQPGAHSTSKTCKQVGKQTQETVNIL